MRILLITEASDAGVGRHFLDLAEGLLADGHDVHLIYSSLRLGRQFAARLEQLPAVPRRVIDMRRGPHPSDLGVVVGVRRYLRQRGPFDVIHGHSSKGGAIARLAGLGSGCAVVYTPHAFVTMDPNLSATARFIYGNIERVLGRLSSSIIALTDDERAAIEQVGIAASRLAVVPNSIAPPNFVPRAEARRRLGLPEHGVAIGFVGRLCHQKDPQLLIRAFARVADLPELPILAMIGDGPLRSELASLIVELGLEGKVHLLGEHPAAELMQAFDVYAMSSLYEGMPYVLLEAMAAGLPIVSMVVSSSAELIRDGENGLLAAERSPAAFGARLQSLIEDAQRRERFSDAARRRSAGFTLEEMIGRTVALYRGLLGGSRRPATETFKATTPENAGQAASAMVGATQLVSDREPTC